METFFYPLFMYRFGRMQICVSDANLIKAQCQAPAFNIGAQFLYLLAGKMINRITHGE